MKPKKINVHISYRKYLKELKVQFEPFRGSERIKVTRAD
jgi:hypothetical protein